MFLTNISIGLIVATIWGCGFHIYTQIMEHKRLYKNCKGDMAYNKSILAKIEAAFSRSEDIINIADSVYATNGIREFLYLRPLKMEEIYYSSLKSLLISLESSNKIMESALFRNDAGKHVMIGNLLKGQTNNIEVLYKALEGSELVRES